MADVRADPALAEGFEPASWAAWLAEIKAGPPTPSEVGPVKVEALHAPGLGGPGPDTSTDIHGFPGLAPFVRGATAAGSTRLCQVVAAPGRGEAERLARAELAGGSHGAEFRLDLGLRSGAGVAAGDGLWLERAEEIAELAASLPAEGEGLLLGLEAGLAARPCLEALLRRGLGRGLAVYADPLAVLVEGGELAGSLEGAFADLAAQVALAEDADSGPTCLAVSTLPWHDAGANAVEELALALAGGIEVLRRLEAAGADLAAVCRRLVFRMRVGPSFFAEIAKLRALRLLWAEATRAADLPARPARLHVDSAWRSRTAADPFVNVLRATAEAFAAVVGGAERLALLPLDACGGPSDEASLRLARNTALVLLEEAQLGRIGDPGGGSWAIETMTRDLAAAAWTRMQAIEAHGGLARGILEGRLQAELAESGARLRSQVATRRLPLTGTSTTPDLGEPLLARLPSVALPAAPSAPATHRPDRVQAPALARLRLAEPFEALRRASEQHARRHGRRPRVALVVVGPLGSLQPRLDFARHFLVAGGIEATVLEPAAAADAAAAIWQAAGADGACICALDPALPELVPALAPLLREAGARPVCLAGRPGPNREAWQAAGVEVFLHLGADLIAAHAEIHRMLEVGR
jgi:methylmalonyl-CoA mutase